MTHGKRDNLIAPAMKNGSAPTTSASNMLLHRVAKPHYVGFRAGARAISRCTSEHGSPPPEIFPSAPRPLDFSDSLGRAAPWHARAQLAQEIRPSWLPARCERKVDAGDIAARPVKARRPGRSSTGSAALIANTIGIVPCRRLSPL